MTAFWNIAAKALALGIVLISTLYGCASQKHAPSHSASAAPTPGAAASSTPAEPPKTAASEYEPSQPVLPGPVAIVQINYAHRGDFLESLTVTKYDEARVILLKHNPDKTTSSVVRFSGGEPVWVIQADRGFRGKLLDWGPPLSLLTYLPGLNVEHTYTLSAVRYGSTPAGYLQVTPDIGLPEPLEPKHYYVFAVERGSRSLSFQTVRVNDDGSLDGYDAQPRVGSSYELCCNLHDSFAPSDNTDAQISSDLSQ